MKYASFSSIFVGCLFVGLGVCHAQSALLGDPYTVSLINLPSDVGTAIDPETQLPWPDSPGTEPLVATFDGVEETFGDIKINERVVAWEGKAGGIHAVQAAGIDGETEFDLVDWENAGEVVEFTFTTTNGEYVSANDVEGQSLITIRDLQWAGAEADAAAQFYENSWYMYYSVGDEEITGMEMLVPDLGLLVGPHPFDETVDEVIYIAYGSGQVEDVVDPIEGGVNLFFGTTQLDETNGSWEQLALAMGFSGLEFFNDIGDTDGFHVGFLATPPATAPLSVVGDFNGDQLLTADDINLLTAALGSDDLSFDLNGDERINSDDRAVWVATLADTYFGDADLDGSVQFPDFLALSAKFGGPGGWEDGDFDGSGDVAFPDFLQLSANFGEPRTEPVAVPEPASLVVLAIGLCCCQFGSRKQRRARLTC